MQVINNLSPQADAGHLLPLCARYVVVFFKDLTVQIEEHSMIRRLAVHWAVGMLADGDCETLGAWPEAIAGVTPWQQILKDISTRGVEKIRFISTPEPTDAPLACFGATALPSRDLMRCRGLASVAPRDRAPAADSVRMICTAATAQAAHTALNSLSSSRLGKKYPEMLASCRAALEQFAPFYALAPHMRRLMLAAEGATERLHTSLSRAVDRNGCFADRQAAISFLVQELQRSERRLGADLKGALSGTLRRASRTRAGFGFGIPAL